MSSVTRNSSISITNHTIAGEKTSRLFFIDHLRVLLTVQVILHHLALTYGALNIWYYTEPTQEPITGLVTTFLIFFNQSFFMGFFFLLSGYFTPGSYDRKGAKAFLRDRLLRLALPLLIYTFILNPLIAYIGVGMPVSFWQFLVNNASQIFAPGPLWFVAALLLFDGCYALWRWLRRAQKSSGAGADSKLPGYALIGAFTLGLALVTFVMRIWIPFGWTLPVIGFIVSNFPQYIALFIIGTLAARRNWFLRMPNAKGKVALLVALGATLILCPLAVLGDGGFKFFVGLQWPVFVYALWESIMGVGMSLGLLILFRQRFYRQGRLGKLVSSNAYCVYIIHALVIVVVAFALHGIQIFPLLKFVLVALISVPLCFACAYLLRKLPFVRAVV